MQMVDPVGLSETNDIVEIQKIMLAPWNIVRFFSPQKCI